MNMEVDVEVEVGGKRKEVRGKGEAISRTFDEFQMKSNLNTTLWHFTIHSDEYTHRCE